MTEARADQRGAPGRRVEEGGAKGGQERVGQGEARGGFTGEDRGCAEDQQAAGQGMSMTIEDGLRLEQHLFHLLASTEDSSEGTRAFAEKREPQWKGR